MNRIADSKCPTHVPNGERNAKVEAKNNIDDYYYYYRHHYYKSLLGFGDFNNSRFNPIGFAGGTAKKDRKED